MFKWLSGRKSEIAKPVEYEDLAGQPLDLIEETIKRVSTKPAVFTVNSGQAISRRLIEIACFDENVEMESRKRALVVEDVLWKHIEDALKNDPDAIKNRREARETHLNHAKMSGVFSLIHKIRHTPPESVASEIINLKNASLLQNFPREPLAGQRGYIIRELLRDRALSQITQDWVRNDVGAVSSLKMANAVVTAGWLVLIRDPTAMWALESDERLELGKYLDDYDRARSKLVALGVIELSQSTTFLPTPEPRVIHDLMLQSASDGSTRDAAGNIERYRARLATLPEDARGDFMTVIFGLRAFIWKKSLASFYGPTFASTVLSANPNARWTEPIHRYLTKLEYLYDVALTGDSNTTGLHNLIVASETLDFIDRSLPKDDQDRLVQGFADILSSELFHFPQYVRSLLRFAIHGETDALSAITEDALDR